MSMTDLKERTLLFTLGVFLLFTFAAEYSIDEYKGVLLSLSFYYGLVGIALALGWDMFTTNLDEQHKAEEGD